MTIKGVKGQQLAMFMTPREIVEGGTFLADADGYDASDYDDGRTEVDMMFADKRRNIERTGFDMTIAREGIREPLSITHNYYGRRALTNGHHRIAATLGTPRYDQLAPVVHSETHREETAYGKLRQAAGAGEDVNWIEDDSQRTKDAQAKHLTADAVTAMLGGPRRRGFVG